MWIVIDRQLSISILLVLFKLILIGLNRQPLIVLYSQRSRVMIGLELEDHGLS